MHDNAAQSVKEGVAGSVNFEPRMEPYGSQGYKEAGTSPEAQMFTSESRWTGADDDESMPGMRIPGAVGVTSGLGFSSGFGFSDHESPPLQDGPPGVPQGAVSMAVTVVGSGSGSGGVQVQSWSNASSSLTSSV